MLKIKYLKNKKLWKNIDIIEKIVYIVKYNYIYWNGWDKMKRRRNTETKMKKYLILI